MKPKIIFFISLMVLILSACSRGSALEQNREKWEAQNFDHYRFTVVVSCFCPFAGAEVTYEVQDGQIVDQAVQAHPDRQFAPDQINEFYQDYNTIEKVFNFVERATNEADETTIEYDPNYGFPTNISVDWIKEAVDDEVYLTLSNFEPL